MASPKQIYLAVQQNKCTPVKGGQLICSSDEGGNNIVQENLDITDVLLFDQSSWDVFSGNLASAPPIPGYVSYQEGASDQVPDLSSLETTYSSLLYETPAFLKNSFSMTVQDYLINSALREYVYLPELAKLKTVANEVKESLRLLKDPQYRAANEMIQANLLNAERNALKTTYRTPLGDLALKAKRGVKDAPTLEWLLKFGGKNGTGKTAEEIIESVAKSNTRATALLRPKVGIGVFVLIDLGFIAWDTAQAPAEQKKKVLAKETARAVASTATWFVTASAAAAGAAVVCSPTGPGAAACAAVAFGVTAVSSYLVGKWAADSVEINWDHPK